MTLSRTLLLIATLTCGVACSAPEFDRGIMRARLASNQRKVDEVEIERARHSRSELTLPFKLAVSMSFPRNPAPGWLNRIRDWTPQDTRVLMGAETELQELGIVTEMVLINEAAIEAHDLNGLRLAAARYDADAVLIVRGASDTVWYWRNWLAVFDFTILGGFLVHASNRDALVMMTGAIWEVDNEHLFATLDAEGFGSVTSPTFLTGRAAQAVAEARQGAVKNFTAQLVDQLLAAREQSER